MRASRDFYDDVYGDESQAPSAERAREGMFLDFLRRVDRLPGRRVLDVGCGTGSFIAAARAAGWQVAGVEVSRPAIAAARRAGLDVSASARDFPAASFDLVTLWNVLEFFEHPLEDLREIRRLLAPGGRLFIRTPNARFQLTVCRVSRLVRRPRALARLLAGAWFLNPLVWDPSSLRALLRTAGLERVTVLNSSPSPGDPYRVLPARRERLISAAKQVLHASACVLAAVSGGTLLLGSSIEAWAFEPGVDRVV